MDPKLMERLQRDFGDKSKGVDLSGILPPDQGALPPVGPVGGAGLPPVATETTAVAVPDETFKTILPDLEAMDKTDVLKLISLIVAHCLQKEETATPGTY